jgi:hypothetical protein
VVIFEWILERLRHTGPGGLVENDIHAFNGFGHSLCIADAGVVEIDRLGELIDPLLSTAREVIDAADFPTSGEQCGGQMMADEASDSGDKGGFSATLHGKPAAKNMFAGQRLSRDERAGAWIWGKRPIKW